MTKRRCIIGSVRLAIVWLVLVACKDREPPKPAPEPVAPRPVAPRCDNPGGTICEGDDVVECLANGELGKRERCPSRCSAGKCIDTCAVRDVELVYVVDNARNLMSFDPKKLPGDPLHSIGRLDCERATTPFSMGVDRMGIAWVLYRSGMLYRVSIIDAKCTRGGDPIGGPDLFGMGFVTDGPDATTEKLFAAAFQGTAFGHVELASAPEWKPRGELPAAKLNPELTGTGAGKLYGFFPDDGGFVQEIDPGTARLVGTRMPVGMPPGRVNGWAFAHWGGKFYVFVTIENNSMVYEVDGKTGRSQRVREHLPSTIVGAGVSTCAPLLEQPVQ